MIRVLSAPVIAVALVAAAPAGDEAAVMAAMRDSAAGWNAGSLDRFMAVYADDARYVTATGVVTGRAAIADRYRASFTATGNARGTLSFERLSFQRLSDRHVVLVARWTLTPAGGRIATGLTTLVFARTPAGWRIVTDHSS